MVEAAQCNGRGGVSDDSYNEHILSLIKPGQLNVLTIHAEVEGISRRQMFEDFLELAKQKGIIFTPLGRLLPENIDELPVYGIELKPISGRAGTVCSQASKESDVLDGNER